MKPLNNYIQIEPEQHQDFIASVTPTYDEIGTVVQVADGVPTLQEGDKVYFDSWMAAKFPAGEGKYYWLVPYENVKAYEPISTERMQGGVSPRLQYSKPTSTGSSGEM
jgi:NADPH:quinone reductase-like Zn-dependent oxidoreductase